MKLRRQLAALAALFLAAACGGEDEGPVGPGGGGVAHLTVTPHADTLLVAETATFEAVAQDENARPVSAQITWSSTDPAVATINADGAVEAVGTGTAGIVAEVAGIADTATLVVRTVSSVTIAPAEQTADIDQQVTYEIDAVDDGGRSVQPDLTWSSLAPDVASATGDGVVRGESEGTARIVATFEPSGAADTATLTVEDVPTNLAVVDLDLLGRGVLTTETTEAELVVANMGGAVSEFEWALRVDGQEIRRAGAPGPAAGTTDTIPLGAVGPLAAGSHEVEVLLDPDDELGESDRSDNTARERLESQPEGFDLKLRFASTFSDEQRALIEAGCDLIAGAIVGDLPDVNASGIDYDRCLQPENEGLQPEGSTLDDLVVLVQADTIDGPGGTLALAAPCHLRDFTNPDRPRWPVTGQLIIDIADLEDEDLDRTVAHEIGHTLGLTSGFSSAMNDELLRDQFTENARWVGALASLQYRTLGGSEMHAPLTERGTHWGFGGELLSRFNRGALSAISIGALGDQFYAVDLDAGESFTVSSASGAIAPSGDGSHLLEGPLFGVNPETGEVRTLARADGGGGEPPPSERRF